MNTSIFNYLVALIQVFVSTQESRNANYYLHRRLSASCLIDYVESCSCSWLSVLPRCMVPKPPTLISCLQGKKILSNQKQLKQVWNAVFVFCYWNIYCDSAFLVQRGSSVKCSHSEQYKTLVFLIDVYMLFQFQHVLALYAKLMFQIHIHRESHGDPSMSQK